MNTRKPSLYFLYAWLFLFSFLPLSFLVGVSFLSHSPENVVAFPVTLSNYQIFFSYQFLSVFFRSLLMAAIVTFFCLLIAYPFSYLMVKSKHKSLLLILIIIPFWTSSLVRTYAILSILKLNGLINFILLYLGIIHTPLHLLYTQTAVIIGLAYSLFPFMVMPIFTDMERFNFQLIDAARDLGASSLAIFFRVFLPNTLSGVISGSLMTLLPAMTLFYIPNLIGGAKSMLLGNLIQDQFLLIENWPQGAATSVLLTVILICALVFLNRQRIGNS